MVYCLKAKSLKINVFYTSWRQSNLHYFLGEGDELDDDVTLYQAPTSSDYQARYLWQPNDQHKLTLTAAGASDSARTGIAKNSEQGRTDRDSIGDARLKTDFNSQLLQYLWQPDADYQLQLSLQQLNNQEDTGFGDQQFFAIQRQNPHAAIAKSLAIRRRSSVRTGPEQHSAILLTVLI